MENMTTETVQEQAASAGDVPASQEGHLESSASILPPKPVQQTAEKQQETTDSAPPNEDAKKWRKSDKEWQEAQEKAKEADQLREKVQEEEKQKTTIQERVDQLEELAKRKDWELEHPIVREERNREVWEAALKEKGDLIRQGRLTYDELWKMTSNEDRSQVNRTLAEQATLTQGSVPSSSRSAPSKPSLDPTTLEMGRAWGNTEEDFRKYGLV